MNTCQNFGLGISCDCAECTQSQQELEDSFYDRSLNGMNQLAIKAAAIRKDGKVFTGLNHAQILDTFSNDYGGLKGGEQGFVTTNDDFVSRSQAIKIAQEAEQIIKLHNPRIGLFSEDLFDQTKKTYNYR